MKMTPKNHPAPTGFTLVELAIALMIIGLLIGGVLKGIELVQNARVTQTARQVTENNTAATAFMSIYNAMPGDIINPQRRVPNCSTLPCSFSGNANGKLEEDATFWIHMSKSNLLSGLRNPDGNTNADFTPKFPISDAGHILILYDLPAYMAHTYPVGNYYSYSTTGSDPVIESLDAAKLDRKMDDGMPYTGDVRAEPYPGLGDDCVLAGDIYNESEGGELCIVNIRIELK